MMSQTLRLSDGRGVHTLKAGKGAPVLLIHGVGMQAEAWTPQIEALSADHLVISADMPGHGQSDGLPDGALLPDFVAWAARVVEALDLGAVNIVGHSMGALIAAGLAVERPDLTARAALISGVYRRSPEARGAVLARASQIAAGAGGIDGPLDRWFTPQEGEVRAQVAGWLGAVPQPAYAAAYRAFAEGDAVYAGRLGHIRCPFLALTGEGDANSTPAMSVAMAAMAQNGRASIIAGHRHMVNLTAPAAVNSDLLRWLSTKENAA